MINTESLTSSCAHVAVEASCAVALDEGALTHIRVPQENNLEHLMRLTDKFALKFG